MAVAVRPSLRVIIGFEHTLLARSGSLEPAADTRLLCTDFSMIRISPRARCLAASIALAGTLVQPPVQADSAAHAPAAAAACAGCHGAKGEGSVTGVPRLAGQSAEYLQLTLSKFKAGRRISTVMQPLARGLNDPQVSELAAYYAAIQAPPAPAAAPLAAELVRAGRELFDVGAVSNPRPPCISCHGAVGRSENAWLPSLAGQPAAYIVNRLHEFQANAMRKAPEPASMADIAAHLDETQVQQVAAYLSTLSR